MTAERPKPTPLWASIARSLRDDIAGGRYAAGDKLPTEHELAHRFGVNRHTVRHALAHLIGEGVLHARRGSGVFVLTRPVEYPLGERVRFHQSLLAAGHLPQKTVRLIETRAASTREAARLALPPGAMICVYHALSFADGNPLALIESHFPEHRLPGLARVLATEPSITRALAAVGVTDFTRASTRLSARAANATQAVQLRLREGAPLLFSTAINVDAGGVPVEYGQTWFAGERITLTLERGDL
ncbi:MAG: phosphonate metabolism transcriptional regulator PhnF [Thermohalobaculum sp.]|nr:phosphonate metabolism transcriptional regulator PhnF [Thermohalobaculum sp.]